MRILQFEEYTYSNVFVNQIKTFSKQKISEKFKNDFYIEH